MSNNKSSPNKKNNLVFDSNKKTNTKATKDTTKSGNLQYTKTNPTKAVKDTSQTGTLQYQKTKIAKAKTVKPVATPKEDIPPMTKKEKIIYGIKVFIFSMIGLVLSGCIILGIIIGNWLADLPELDTTLLTEVSQSSLIYDKNGALLATYSSYENREWAELEEIPEDLKQAVLSIEDHDFYNHNGIYYKRLAGAILGQIMGTDDYGGSTITQQLIKNVYLTSEVTYKRKAQELVLALELESKMSKDDILEAYLNIIYLGGSNYGVKAAANDYFGKTLDELTTRECAMIAGLAKNPNGFSPRRNMEKGDMSPTNNRTDDVLWAMHNQGKLSDTEYELALIQDVVVKEGSSYSQKYPYPHFVEYVLDEVAADLLKQEGKEVTEMNIIYKKYSIRNGGYQIYTTIDPKAQEILQQTAAEFNSYPETEDGNGVEVSSVIIDQHTGEIVAMIGSKNEPVAQETFNRAVDSTQPIGSTMKPIAIFAPAIEKGFSPASLVGDYQSPIKGYDNEDGYPGGACSFAPSTMRRAVQNSHNIPAARFLMEVGMETASDYLIRLGVNADNISKNGSGLALGTSDVTTLEITGAYAAIANDGVYIEPHAYTSVLNRKDEEILSAKDKATRRVFSEATAWLSTDMMISEVASGGGSNARINGITVAGKTGTHENKCITFAGYTGYYTSVIRISSDSYSSMYSASGGVQTAKLWQQYMSKIHEGLEDKPIQSKTDEELDLKRYSICTISGDLATDNCKALNHTAYDYFLKGTQPTKSCTAHIKVCSETGMLATSECEEAGTVIIATYISPSCYLYQMNHDQLAKSIKELRLDAITEDCIHNPEPEEPEPSEDPNDPNNPNNPDDPNNPGFIFPPEEPEEPEVPEEPDPEPEEPEEPEQPENPDEPENPEEPDNGEGGDDLGDLLNGLFP